MEIIVILAIVVSAIDVTGRETSDDYKNIDGGLSCSKEHGSIKDCSSSLPEVTHLIGVTDFVQNGPKFLSIGDLETYIEKSIRRFRTGQIFAFATDKKDPYLLPCDGASYYKADYPDLYEALKNTIDTEVSWDNSKFRVPEMHKYPYLRAVARDNVGEKFRQSPDFYGFYLDGYYVSLMPYDLATYAYDLRKKPKLYVNKWDVYPNSYGVYYAIHI